MGLSVRAGLVLIKTVMIWYFFGNLFTKFKVRRSLYALYYIMVFAWLFLLNDFFVGMEFYQEILIFLFLLTGNLLIYDHSLFEVLIWTILYLSVTAFSRAIGYVASQFLPIPYDGLNSYKDILFSITITMQDFILLQLLLTVKVGRRKQSVAFMLIPLLIFQPLSLYISYRSFYLITEDTWNFFLSIQIALLYANALLVLYLDRLTLYHRRELAAIAAEKQSALQIAYYTNLTKRQEESRALWHDIKKYHDAMKLLVNCENKPELEACFDEVNKKIQWIGQCVDVENPIVNGILTYAADRAERFDVHLNLDIWIAPDLNMAASDLYIILGNTIDNAIEAVSELKAEERTVYILLHQKQNMLLYEISNAYKKGSQTKTGALHGYGLRNVRACTDKYEGDMEICAEDGKYDVRIKLNLQTQNTEISG